MRSPGRWVATLSQIFFREAVAASVDIENSSIAHWIIVPAFHSARVTAASVADATAGMMLMMVFPAVYWSSGS